ncbi:hypothetical protein BYT27DRAFT_7196788 [Phlegmacium glaucopus]|nr:hypothetical protein BYT27DRAFT_7196788 [Phlegmacium glaucopus]
MSAQGNTTHMHEQPSATPAMSPTANSEAKDVAKTVGKEYLKAVAKEGGKETMQYEKANAQQQLDEAKAEAQVCFPYYSIRL